MACNTSCTTILKQAYSYDTSIPYLYKNSACSGANSTLGCGAWSIGSCGFCGGCSYWQAPAGTVSCWSDSSCTIPCGGADEFGNKNESHFYQVGIWVGISCLALVVAYMLYRKKASKE